MGTNVVSGTASAIVLTTGRQTCFGALAERVTAERPEVTAFQAGVNKVSWLLIRFMFVMAPLVLLINGVTKGDWLDAALFALSIAVGLTPEMLPMIVTAALASKAGQAKFEYGTPQISDSGLQPPATGNHGAGAEASAPAPKPCNLEPNGGHDE